MLTRRSLSLTAKASLLHRQTPAPKFTGTPRKGVGTVLTK